MHILYKERPSPVLRPEIVLAIFTAAASWIDPPKSIMLLNYLTWEQRDEAYSPEALSGKYPIGDVVLAFVYPLVGSAVDGSLGIKENNGMACYSLNIPIPKVQKRGHEEVEHLLGVLLTTGSRFGHAVVIAGEELEVDLDEPFEQVVQKQLSAGSQVILH
jgi:hypothetical protein